MDRKAKARQQKRKERERRVRARLNQERAARREGLPLAEPGVADELPAADDGDFPRASEFLSERLFRRLALLRRGRSFADEDELKAFFKEYADRPVEQIAAEFVEADPHERAQELAFRAMESEDRDQMQRLAAAALEVDADCVDALMLTSFYGSTTSAELIAALRRAVDAGRRRLDALPPDAGDDGRYWEDVDRRPYLRAREALAGAYRAARRDEEAIHEYEGMLELHPSDDQGVRYPLLGLALERGDLDRARGVLERFVDDGTAMIRWARVLERFLSDDRAGAAAALREAKRRNPHVEATLMGDLTPEEDERGFKVGVESEAAELLRHLGAAWARNPRALDWLADGGRETTKRERREAVASYGGRVARLLYLGEPGSDQAWRDYVGEFRLDPSDVPELVRIGRPQATFRLRGFA